MAAALAVTTGCSNAPVGGPLSCDPTQVTREAPRPADEPPAWVPPPPGALEHPGVPHWIATHFWLPWDYEHRQLYPIAPEGTVYIRLQYRVAPQFAEPLSARLIVFVDGKVTPFDRADGETVTLERTALVDRQGETSISLPAERFQDGLSTVQVYVHYHAGPSGWQPELGQFGELHRAKGLLRASRLRRDLRLRSLRLDTGS